LKLHTATSAEIGLIVTLVLLAILVGAALWISRPLFGLAVDSLWHLQYTLVFPIFVALRELLRTVYRTVPQ